MFAIYEINEMIIIANSYTAPGSNEGAVVIPLDGWRGATRYSTVNVLCECFEKVDRILHWNFKRRRLR